MAMKNMATQYSKMVTEVGHKPTEKILSYANERVPFKQATAILDNGCGPGPVMERLLAEYKIPNRCTLTCADGNDGMLEQLRKKKEKHIAQDPETAWTRVNSLNQDATNLKDLGDGTFSHITAGWVYFLTADPKKCLEESKRVLQSGGVLSLTSWHSNQWIELVRCIEELRPNATMWNIPEAWTDPAALKPLMESAGFVDVGSEYIDTTFTMDSIEDIVSFLLSAGMMFQGHLETLNEDEKTQLRELMIKKGYQFCPDKPCRLKGLALVAAGKKP